MIIAIWDQFLVQTRTVIVRAGLFLQAWSL